MNISSQLLARFSVSEALTLGAATVPVPIPFSGTLNWTSGTGAGQADLHWETSPTVTLAAGASQTFTLSGLVDGLLRTVALKRVVAWALLITSRTAGDHLIVGDPGGTLTTRAWASPFGGVATGQLIVFDQFALGAGTGASDGWAVGSGANDQLLVKNAGSNPITFSLCFLGTSA